MGRIRWRWAAWSSTIRPPSRTRRSYFTATSCGCIPRAADLQEEKAQEFNHPRLVPQFVPRIPSYKADLSSRLGIVVEQHLPLNSWTNHLQQAYYDHADIPSWTLEHPASSPLEQLLRGLPTVEEKRRHDPLRPWYKNGITPQDYPWVDPETSLQWRAFQCVAKTLRGRGNRLFVLVGPFNEHLLTPPSLERYRVIQASVALAGGRAHPLRHPAGFAERAVRRREPSTGRRV